MTVAAATGEVFQVKLVGTIEAQQCINTYYFKMTGSGDADVLTHLVLVLLQCFIDNMMPLLPSTYTLEKAQWRLISPTLGPEFESIPTGSTTGPKGAALPSYCSALISLHSTRPGKSGRGRLFIAGIPEDQTTNSNLSPTEDYWAALLAFALCLVTNFVHPDEGVGAEEWSMQVYSRKIGGATPPYGASGFASVVEIAPQRLIATTRSRKIGRGI